MGCFGSTVAWDAENRPGLLALQVQTFGSNILHQTYMDTLCQIVCKKRDMQLLLMLSSPNAELAASSGISTQQSYG